MIPTAWRHRLLVAAVALTAAGASLPTGGAGATGQLVTRLTAFACLGLAALATVDGSPVRRLATPLATLAGLAVLGLLQSIAWPWGVARLVSGEHAELTRTAQGLLGGETQRAALSLAPELSRSAALALAAAGAFLYAAFVAGGRRRARRWLAVAVVAGALLQLVLGTRGWLAGATPRLNGTFVNPNHLAYALEIALAVSFAWASWAAHELRRVASLERRLGLMAAPVTVWLVLAAGLVATGSRAGLAAMALATLVQSLLLPRVVGGARREVVVKALVGAALAALTLTVARGPGRLGETTLYEVAWGDRAVVWRESLGLWWRFPLTGSGLGTFGEAFPLVQPAAMTELYWRRAHNDLVELLVTGGIVALVLALTLTLGVARSLTRVLRRGRRTEDRAAALAALGACAAVATHEMMDFGLTLSGVALPLAAVVGAAAAARLSSRSPGAEPVPDAAAGGRRSRSSRGGARPVRS